jgi:CubicO group peptidase (beta-lactamase class C family)
MKKLLYSVLLILLIPITALTVYATITGKWFIFKAIRYNFVDIDDYKIFDNRTFYPSKNPYTIPTSSKYNQVPLTDTLNYYLHKYKTRAYIVIKNDSILHEQYWNGHTDTTISNSFSMAKSVISLLIGCAIKDGLIQSLDQPVADFIPEYANDERKNITIKHLLQMSSGLDFDESKSYQNPISVFFSDIMEAYYGNDLYSLMTRKKVAAAPGQFFDYKSGDTQLLSFVISKATGKTISQYFEEKIYKPMGAASRGLWCLDRENGVEKAFCCINTTAKDFAKIGLLLLNKGMKDGVQILDSNYIKEATTPLQIKDAKDTTKFASFYGYQFWIMDDIDPSIYYLRGTLGQMIIIIPKKDMVIVRLGENQGVKKGTHHYDISYKIVEEAIKMYQ